MTDKKSSESRRKLLKSIAAGSGAVIAGRSLPDSWSRPVVDSVILPAHAQTSQITGVFAYNYGSNETDLIEVLVPSASAIIVGAEPICIDVENGLANFFVYYVGTFWTGSAQLPVSTPLALTPAASKPGNSVTVTAAANTEGTMVSGNQNIDNAGNHPYSAEITAASGCVT